MRTHRMIAAFAGLALVVAACGDDDVPAASNTTAPATDSASSDSADPVVTEPTTPATTQAPATTEPSSEETVITEPDLPSAIISLSPSATEMLYAIGAGDQVLAVDDFSNYPDETASKMQGLNAFEPNIEAIGGLQPDLVITDGTNADLLAQLDSIDVAHWEGPAAVTFDDIYTQIEQLGAVTGHVGEAAELVGQMQTDIAAVIDTLPVLDAPLTYYHELDSTYFSVTSDTFIGLVYTEAGLVNIADAVGDGNPYPQLNAEFIIDADPDLIFLACTKYCGETAETVAARPGWGDLSAIVNGNVIGMDDDVASRWGPRIVDYIEQVGAAVKAAAAVPAG